ncbi:MAG: PorT family protein [Muribaculaceae bacterium]|nr:PorT family protein [Muribaculaceae bacterium]
MKKILLLAAAAIMGMSAANAQVEFGAKVGFDLTNYWGEDVSHTLQPNYQAGLVMEYHAAPKFSVAPEVVFAAQGGKSDNFTFHANYVNVPVMLKYYVAPAFSIDFGPQVGFNVYSKVTPKDQDALDLGDMTNTVDFGLGLGATYNLTNNAFIQARYTMGLTKVYKDQSVDVMGYKLTTDNKAKNGNIQISFGMKF